MTFILYIAVAAVFMLLAGFRLFADGMFVDGVTYAAISRNLSEGIGTFWEPHLTATLYPQFHEHPPLAIGMQGLMFRIFGDHPLVERLYSLAAILITGYLIVLIWNELTGEKKSGWIPLLIWILFPLVPWAASSNLLDNTLGIFTTLSIWLIIKSSKQDKFLYLVLAGLSIFAGLLTKGPFALFPWVLPLLWISQPDFRLGKVAAKTIVLVISTLLPLAILVTFSPVARESLHTYWTNQVAGSLSHVTTVSTRFYILGVLLSQLALPVFAGGLILLVCRRTINLEAFRAHRKPVILLILFGLCGVLPIMISMKQSSFYILSALPIFAIAIALAVWTMAGSSLSGLKASPSVTRRIRLASILLLAGSLIIPPVVARHSGRDKQELEMIRDFSRMIPAGSVIRIDPALYTEWGLHSYFMRYSKISLDPKENPGASFYLGRKKDQPEPGSPTKWVLAGELNGYVLYRRPV